MKRSYEWVQMWLKYCNINKIAPWEFDFKLIYMEKLPPSATSHLEFWLKYKHTKELDNPKLNPFANVLEKMYIDHKDMRKDPDKAAFPIYNFLGWQNNEVDVVRGDHMNSFQTTFTPLLMAKSTKTLPAPFSSQNSTTWENKFYEIPNISTKLKEWAKKENDAGVSNIKNFEFSKEEHEIWDNFEKFAKMTDTIGNFTVLPYKLNTARGTDNAIHDYWDITLSVLFDFLMSIENEGQKAWEGYIEKHFLQPFVKKSLDENMGYPIGELWKEHLKFENGTFTNGVYPRKISDFEQFYRNVNLLIEERGKWITKILCEKSDLTGLDFYKDTLADMKEIRYFDDIIK